MSGAVVIDFTSRRAATSGRLTDEHARQARHAELAGLVDREFREVSELAGRVLEAIKISKAAAASPAADGPIWRPAPRPLASKDLDEMKARWLTHRALVDAVAAQFESARNLAWAEHHANVKRLNSRSPLAVETNERYRAAAWRLMVTAPFDIAGLRWKLRHRALFDDRKHEVAAILADDERWLEIRSGANRRARAAASHARRR